MYTHHEESVARTTEHFNKDAEVLALLLGGSIAHGFAAPASDVDVLMVLSDADHERRRARGEVMFYDPSLCTYEGGYVDGKYLSVSFLKNVAASGSEPARFAFKDARVLFSRVDGLDDLLQAITRYPVERKADRIRRFYAQLEAWHWYAHEGLKRENQYLIGAALSKLVLFGGRMILAHNELLYPYHKWFIQVLASAPDKPGDLLQCIEEAYAQPSATSVDRFYETVKNFRAWETSDTYWPNQFMLDSELNWLSGNIPIDDL
jgi:hypothetical protein